MDLLHMSEEELENLWVDDPDILDDLVRDSKLPPDELAEIFVKHPILQSYILKYSDPVELYNAIYDSQIENANPADYDHDNEEYKKIQTEYKNALNAIKQYASRDPYYSETHIADAIFDAPVEVEDWDDPYGSIKKAKNEYYEEGIELGLNKYEIDELPNYDIALIASILEEHQGALSYVKKVLEQNGKTLDVSALVDYLVDEIDEPYFDSDYGYEDVVEKKRVLKELGYDYEEIKDAEREEDDFYINEYGEIIRQGNEEVESTSKSNEEHSKESIDSELEQWLNGGKSKTPLQQKEEELSALEKEEKTISEAEALIDQQKEGQDIGEE